MSLSKDKKPKSDSSFCVFAQGSDSAKLGTELQTLDAEQDIARVVETQE